MGKIIKNSTKLKGATPYDSSGLLINPEVPLTKKEIEYYEAKNISKAVLKYLSNLPTTKQAPFTYEWFLKLHKEMFGDVWEWAGKIRKTELNIGVKSHLIRQQLAEFALDIDFYKKNHTYDVYETSARIHHKSVFIHPFLNGNGRWARMLANIYLKQEGKMPVKWQNELLAKENPERNLYIKALKLADQEDFRLLIEMHKKTY